MKAAGDPTSQGGSRLIAGLRAAWTQWFGPGVLQPQQTPEGFLPRRFDYPSFINTGITPRATEQTSFAQLRNLADAYYLIRSVIETRKDQIVKLPWRLARKPKKGDISSESKIRSENDPDVKKLTTFFQYPDRDHNWETWLRMLMEDMLVIDAACVYPWHSKGGDIIACLPMDGATIKPVVDPMGLRPQEGTAYQQIIKGQIYSELTKNQLLYMPRNPRTNRLYGFSPVEQMILIVNLGIRRAIYQINYYTEGNVPEAIAEVPDTWSPDQIKQFQTYFDAALAGDLAARRRITFVPATAKGNIQFTREATLKDEMDEYLARVTCYVFSVPPTPFVRQMNRASAEQQNKAALQEGTEASKTWIKALVDELVQSPRFFGKPSIEFNWDDEPEIDQLKKAQIDDLSVRNGQRSIDELRERDGLDPIGVGPGIITMNGFTLLKDAIKQSKKIAEEPLPTPGAGGAPAAEGGKEKKPADKKAAATKLAKAAVKKKVTVMTGTLPETATKRAAAMTSNVGRFLSKQGKKIAAQAAEAYSHVTKDDADEVERIVADIDLEWAALVSSVESSLQDTATEAAATTLTQVGIIDDGIFGKVNEAALDFAKERAAELVGMKYVDGELVANPNAAYAITETTREELRNIVTKAFADGMSPAELEAAIEQSFQFSGARAEMIARTELSAAHVGGALEAAKGSGVVVGKRILLGSEHVGPDECDLAALLGVIGLDDEFLGDDGPPLHPNCVLPGTEIAACDFVTKQFRRRFHGEVAVISVSSGEQLSITVNHPVLTNEGWVAAGLLKKGMRLLRARDQIGLLMSVSPDHNLMPTLAEDIFSPSIIASSMATGSMPLAAEDFHGDAIADSEIEIVWPKSSLEYDGKFRRGYFSQKPPFSNARRLRPSLPAESPPGEFGSSSFSPPGSAEGMGSNRASLLARHEAIGGSLTFANRSDAKSEAMESISQRRTVHSDAPSEINARLSSHIELVEITNASRTQFDGHVYNLETESGYYLANGLIVHNCVCGLELIYEGEE